MEDNKEVSKLKAFIVPVIILVVLGAMLFLPAGSLGFWQAWIFWPGFSVLTLFVTIYFLKKSPDLLSRRMQLKEKKSARKTPAFLNYFFLGYIVPGLDFRFQWSAIPEWVVIASNIIVFLGYIFIIVVFNENRYASTLLQVEKKQQVISTGPYSFVRHPMYLGMLIMSLFTPLALGSYWAMIPFLLCIPYVVLRIKSEEEMLLLELPEYKEYCTRTRYRLIPLIW